MTDEPTDEPPAQGEASRPGDEAIAVETYVEERKGRWVVELVVVFPDEAVRKTINEYRTEREAQIAASWIKRAAARDLPN